MKSIFLYSKQKLPLNLEKINQSLYYDSQTDQFYRLNVMPQCTVFASEDVEQRQMMSLTRYDPAFYMINMLYNNKAVDSTQLPHYLKKKSWNLFASEITDQGKTFYSLNRQKVYNFLERKVKALEKYLDQHNPLDRLKLIKNTETKTISPDSITLLKNEICQYLVADFIKERFNQQESRKIVPMQEIEPQALKPKPQKNNKKPESKKDQSIPKNQQTLFGSWGKK